MQTDGANDLTTVIEQDIKATSVRLIDPSMSSSPASVFPASKARSCSSKNACDEITNDRAIGIRGSTQEVSGWQCDHSAMSQARE